MSLVGRFPVKIGFLFSRHVQNRGFKSQNIGWNINLDFMFVCEWIGFRVMW